MWCGDYTTVAASQKKEEIYEKTLVSSVDKNQESVNIKWKPLYERLFYKLNFFEYFENHVLNCNIHTFFSNQDSSKMNQQQTRFILSLWTLLYHALCTFIPAFMHFLNTRPRLTIPTKLLQKLASNKPVLYVPNNESSEKSACFSGNWYLVSAGIDES